MTAALHGNLRDFGIGEVFQLIGQQRKSGVLEVRRSGGSVELRFDSGRIVSAAPAGGDEHTALGEMLVRCGLLTRERLTDLEEEREVSLCSLPQLLVDRGLLSPEQIAGVEDLLTQDTIFDLLCWEDGSFRFDAREVRHTRDPDALLGAEQVLMDGLRMVDEWRTFADEVPSESIVFHRSGSFEDYRRARAGGDGRGLADEERVWLRIDGRLNARRVIDLSRLGTFEGTRVLAELRRMRLIEPTAAPRSARGTSPAAPRVRGGLRRALAGVFGVAALLVLALVSHGRVGVEPAGAGMRLERDLLEEARLRYESRRVRHAVEAHRLASGRTAHGLEEVASWSQRAGVPLTLRSPGAYHVIQDGSGWLVLAPEH